jgi:hypothetical protein
LWLKLLLGCGTLVGLGLLALVAVLVAVGVGIETGDVPDTAALPAGKIPPRTIARLRSLGIVEPGETVLYFYSQAMWSVEGDGNLFTDRRVISYQKDEEGGLELFSATWDRVDDLTFENSDSWLEDSTITVFTDDGNWFVLLVSAEGGRDDDFYAKLERRWKAARE